MSELYNTGKYSQGLGGVEEELSTRGRNQAAKMFPGFAFWILPVGELLLCYLG
jgi:hypothetical protein